MFKYSFKIVVTISAVLFLILPLGAGFDKDELERLFSSSEYKNAINSFEGKKLKTVSALFEMAKKRGDFIDASDEKNLKVTGDIYDEYMSVLGGKLSSELKKMRVLADSTKGQLKSFALIAMYFTDSDSCEINDFIYDFVYDSSELAGMPPTWLNLFCKVHDTKYGAFILSNFPLLASDYQNEQKSIVVNNRFKKLINALPEDFLYSLYFQKVDQSLVDVCVKKILDVNYPMGSYQSVLPNLCNRLRENQEGDLRKFIRSLSETLACHHHLKFLYIGGDEKLKEIIVEESSDYLEELSASIRSFAE